MPNHTQRFSNRVKNYIKYRPSYPLAVLEYLEVEHSLTKNQLIADIGSGTGILTELFLNRGYNVVAIEPNDPMREAAESLLRGYSNFNSINGAAEATKLTSISQDWVVVAQAFHWFEPRLSKLEFQRILKPGGKAALIWNERLMNNPFLKAYEAFLHEHSTDYGKSVHRNFDMADFNAFFAPFNFHFVSFPNQQFFNREALLGRYLSSSYAYTSDHPKFELARKELFKIFDQFAVESEVSFNYATQVYVGQLRACWDFCFLITSHLRTCRH